MTRNATKLLVALAAGALTLAACDRTNNPGKSASSSPSQSSSSTLSRNDSSPSGSASSRRDASDRPARTGAAPWAANRSSTRRPV